MLICVDTPFPTFEEIYEQIKNSLTHPPLFDRISVPEIISTLKKDMFSAVNAITGKVESVIKSVNMEIVFLAQELSNMSFWGLIQRLIAPLVKIIGVAIRIVLPEIPGLGISIVDILTGKISPEEIYNRIKKAISSGLKTLWGFVPDPFHVDLNIPDISVVQIFQFILKEYAQMVIEKIKWVINAVMLVMDILHAELFAFHAAWVLFTEKVLPLFPSFSDIIDGIYAKVKSFASFFDKEINFQEIIEKIEQGIVDKYTQVMSLCHKLIEKGVKLSDLLKSKFEKLMSYLHPDNIFKTVKSIGIELMLGLNNMMHSFFNQICSFLWNFLTGLPIIGDIIKGVFFGKICIPVPFVGEVVSAISEAQSAVSSAFGAFATINNVNFDNIISGVDQFNLENQQIVTNAKSLIGDSPFSVNSQTIASTQQKIASLSQEAKGQIETFFQQNFARSTPVLV